MSQAIQQARPAPSSCGTEVKLPLNIGRRTLTTLADEVRSDATFRIPIVDFQGFRHATSTGEKARIADAIVGAFKEVGFVYIKNHGIPDAVVKDTFQKSADFFKQPSDVKNRLAWDDPRANRGYVRTGRERVTQSANVEEIAAMRAKAPDSKESMEIGRDWDKNWKNKWPEESEVPRFKTIMKDFFQTCHELHVSVMSSVAMGLGMQEDFFNTQVNEQYHNLRLLSYPPIKSSLLKQEGQARAGAHSDYGSLTFVFQDSVGGLEVQNPHTKQFHPATPIDGTIVVNVGDLLARWSNDVLRSTLHRVVAPRVPIDDDAYTPARQSIAFFCNPNGGAKIECLPHCHSDLQPRKYQPITTEEYIVGR
ncbi:Clavaminate synthase-like protein [Hysterangium stoloniferum]|nr:Clavaminate synthase-like protein [Hysterangium stoloniferum]